MRKVGRIGVVTTAVFAFASLAADACTRFVYQTGTEDFIIGRSMDWADDPGTDLWAFPRGMERDGGMGAGSVKWTSTYGSVVSSFYDIATVDGMNDAGLVANALYLVESDYGDAKASGKPLMSVGAWTAVCPRQFRHGRGRSDGLECRALRHCRPRSAGWKESGWTPRPLRRFRRQCDLRVYRRQAGHSSRPQIHRDDQFAVLRPAACDRNLLARGERPEFPSRHHRLRRPVCADELEFSTRPRSKAIRRSPLPPPSR